MTTPVQIPTAATEGPVRPLGDKGFLFVGGGLGDVARRFYTSNTYEILRDLTELTPVICYSHNPSALEFFRFHRNHERIVLFDMGHYYMSLMRKKIVDAKELNRRVFAACGFPEIDRLAKPRPAAPIGWFDAPDVIANSHGHVVIHPFGRGWGDWPGGVMTLVEKSLRSVSKDKTIFVISADYVCADGRRKTETFPCDLENVVVLKNLSAPAAFSLVATASRFVGTMSSLAQVAAFERIPSVVMHPEVCRDFRAPFSSYARTILESNGANVPFDACQPEHLDRFLTLFLESAGEPIDVRATKSGVFGDSMIRAGA